MTDLPTGGGFQSRVLGPFALQLPKIGLTISEVHHRDLLFKLVFPVVLQVKVERLFLWMDLSLIAAALISLHYSIILSLIPVEIRSI